MANLVRSLRRTAQENLDTETPSSWPHTLCPRGPSISLPFCHPGCHASPVSPLLHTQVSQALCEKPGAMHLVCTPRLQVWRPLPSDPGAGARMEGHPLPKAHEGHTGASSQEPGPDPAPCGPQAGTGPITPDSMVLWVLKGFSIISVRRHHWLSLSLLLTPPAKPWSWRPHSSPKDLKRQRRPGWIPQCPNCLCESQGLIPLIHQVAAARIKWDNSYRLWGTCSIFNNRIHSRKILRA